MNDAVDFRLKALKSRLDHTPVYAPVSRVVDAYGWTVQAKLPTAKIGEICEMHDPVSGRMIEAEVIGFRNEHALLAPSGDLRGFSLGAQIKPTGREKMVPAGDGLLGRVVDANVLPLDGLGPLRNVHDHLPLYRDPPSAMKRRMIKDPFQVGIRAIDGLLTCGEGQRIGIFGEPGGGKSTLLASLVKGCQADVCVVGLIGERGREVREFVEETLGEEALRRSVLVVSTSDRPAVDRAAAAFTATAVAEYFRDQGKKVLLVVDSITRFARAQRDIGLASGEIPTRRGFPTSVFAKLPGLLERAGQGQGGSITAFYTVLVEGDGTGDPIAEEVRSILDGHIVLSADLAARNHYPAIDVLKSKSRVMGAVTSEDHRDDTGDFLSLLAKFNDVEFLVQVGEYQSGSDAVADRAIQKSTLMMDFLKQRASEQQSLEDARQALRSVLA